MQRKPKENENKTFLYRSRSVCVPWHDDQQILPFFVLFHLFLSFFPFALFNFSFCFSLVISGSAMTWSIEFRTEERSKLNFFLFWFQWKDQIQFLRLQFWRSRALVSNTEIVPWEQTQQKRKEKTKTATTAKKRKAIHTTEQNHGQLIIYGFQWKD